MRHSIVVTLGVFVSLAGGRTNEQSPEPIRSATEPAVNEPAPRFQ